MNVIASDIPHVDISKNSTVTKNVFGHIFHACTISAHTIGFRRSGRIIGQTGTNAHTSES
jgi:hypothetical protein